MIVIHQADQINYDAIKKGEYIVRLPKKRHEMKPYSPMHVATIEFRNDENEIKKMRIFKLIDKHLYSFSKYTNEGFLTIEDLITHNPYIGGYSQARIV